MIKVNRQEVKFDTFPNGETMLVKDSIKCAVNRQTILFKYTNDADLIKLMFVKRYFDQMLYDDVILYITYMPYSRMDRSENYSPFTLKYVTDFINGLNFSAIVVVEPHSDVTTALLDRAIAKYINFDLVEKVKEEVGFDSDNDYLVFPDAGASKRYSKMKAKNVLVGHKNRDFETGKITSLRLVGESLPASTGRKAIIVDDLSSYGGTFVRTSEELRKIGFDEVYLLVAHAENSMLEGKLFDNVDKVFTTDSLLTRHKYWHNLKHQSKLKVYDIEGVLSNV